MGRVAIRTAIQEQIQALAIPYVGTVFPARPVIMEEQSYTQTLNGEAIAASASGSACMIVVNMPRDKRRRMALVGRGAVDDMNKHQICLELFFASTEGAGIQAQYDYDSIVDALVVAIRAQPSPGGAAVVWSAGEFDAGVAHEMAQPYTSEEGNTILINGVIKYEAWEQDIGNNV